MITTASPYLKSLLTSGTDVKEGVAFPLRRVTDPAIFEEKFTALFEMPVGSDPDAPLYRIEEDGIILAWVNYTLEETDGPEPAILFKKVTDPTPYIGYNPADLFEHQVRQLTEFTKSSVLAPRGSAGKPKRVVGGFRFTTKQRQKKDRSRALNIDSYLAGKRAGRRGLAKRIQAARKWHQSFQGSKMHAAQGRYQQQTKEAIERYSKFLTERMYCRFHKGVGEVGKTVAKNRVDEQPVHLRAFESGLDLALGESFVFVFDKQNHLTLIPAEAVVRHASLCESSILFNFPDTEIRDKLAQIIKELGIEIQPRDSTRLWVRFYQTTDAQDILRMIRANGGQEIELTENLYEKEFATMLYDPSTLAQYDVGAYRKEFGKDPWQTTFFFNKEERIEAAKEVLARLRYDLRSPSSTLFARSYGKRGGNRVRLYKLEGMRFERAVSKVLDGPGAAKGTAGYRHDTQVDTGSDKGKVPVEVKNTQKTIFRVTEISPEETRSEPSDVFVVRRPSLHNPDKYDQIDVYVPDTKSFRVGKPESKGPQLVRRTYGNINKMHLIGTIHQDPSMTEDLDELSLHVMLQEFADLFGYTLLDQMPCGMVYVERQSGEVVISACEHLLLEEHVASIRRSFALAPDAPVRVYEDHYDPMRMLRECTLSVATTGRDIQQAGPRSWVIDGKQMVLYSPLSKFVRVYPLMEIFKKIGAWIKKKMPRTFDTPQKKPAKKKTATKKPAAKKPAAKKPAAKKPAAKKPAGPKGKVGRPRMTDMEKRAAEKKRERAAYVKGVARGIKQQRKQTTTKKESVELREALDFRVLEDRMPFGKQEGDLYKSLRNLVKTNDGLWKSDRQGSFILASIKRGGKRVGTVDSLIHALAKKFAPEGTQGVIYTEMVVSSIGGRQFGGKTRRLEYIYFVDAHGILRELKIEIEYDDDNRASRPKGQTVTFDRPMQIAAELQPKENTDARWFATNREVADKVIDALQGDSYFGKFVRDLQAGEKPADKIWAMMVKEMQKRTAGYPPFPTTPTKTEITLHVTKARWEEKEYEGHSSYVVTFMGDVDGYSEFGFINVGDATVQKAFIKHFQPKLPTGEPDWVMALDDIVARAIGKTLKLRGTFNGNGKMIFGKRVSILGIAESHVRVQSLADAAAVLSYEALFEGERRLSVSTEHESFLFHKLDSGLFDVYRNAYPAMKREGFHSFGEAVALLAKLPSLNAPEISFNEKELDEEHTQFLKWVSENEQQLDEGVLDFLKSIPSALTGALSFLKELAVNTGLKLSSLIPIFKNPAVYKFFGALKWSFTSLFDLLKKGFKAYGAVLDVVAEFIAKNPVVKWTEEKLKALDDFLQKHPKVRLIGGIAVAALLAYIWFTMTFTGDPIYDFDMTDLLLALGGSYSLSKLFAGKAGVKLLMLFATGALTGLSFPWPGAGTAKFAFAIISTLAKWLKIKVTKATSSAATESVLMGEGSCA